MSVEGLAGTDAVFAADLQALRPHPGQAQSAANMRTVLEGSGAIAAHRTNGFTRVQDAYSLRCAPQVHGAARDTLAYARVVAERELASAIDNPVVTIDGRVESNGNFHGAPIGYVLDFLAIVVADVASDERAPHRPLSRQDAQWRAQSVPRSRPRSRFGAHDRAIHASRNRERVEETRGTRIRRLDSDERDARGPRLDGVERRPQVAARHRRSAARARDRAHDRGARHRDEGGCHPPPFRRESSSFCGAACRGPGPDRYLAPDIAAAVELVVSGELLAASGLGARA